ncbi:MAG: ATP-binding protein [Prevotella sp.]|nr:ATP-binding protein [Prevotella sp.]
MTTEKPKRIPYGMQNWEDVRLDNCYYVDKTRFIPEIEASNNYFFFIRPRRFGKSLLMNMLRQYYDLRKADRFDRLFGDLWIGSHPTPMHNKYLVLHLNFSLIGGSIEGYEEDMNSHCRIQVKDFCHRYADLLPPETLEGLKETKTARAMIDHINVMARTTGQQIYIFIDEYDHFTNAILADPSTEAAYKAQTHGTGAFREFFNALKGGSDSAIKRLFITGVSPVTMDDLTSGFNIGTNYTTQPEFNAMVGFTEQEVREMIDYYRQYYTFNHTTDELIEVMKPWYDNYCFAPECIDESPLYNSDMVLYFIDNYIRRKGRIPKKMLDANIRTDYSKLRMLIRKDRGFEHNASIIQHIVETGTIAAELKDHFPSEDITNPSNFVSLLYYFGMLSIAGEYQEDVVFRIPNQVVREQMYGYLTRAYGENELSLDEYRRSKLMSSMAWDGNWRPFFDFIAETLRRFSSQRDKAKGEAYVHGFTLSQTCLSNVYLPVSELDAGPKSVVFCQDEEVEAGGYADIYLQPLLGIYPDLKHSYVLELKYLPGRATDADVARAREKAIDQITRYAKAVAIERTYKPTTLHRLVLLWRGMELAVAEEIHVNSKEA